ncbi:MAG: DNA mismatch repair endonuclease MutL [Deltaproteobacteria bacterium]|nr:DNA mismatch repair endonuclease MutL [Deltaproteobacteria bacterium]
MSKIKILPEILSNKIAAGEVVERPASVVKELIENALDAGGRKIIIEVEKGGSALIRVSDNGAGMDHDDALMAIERYATSKIYEDRDLFSIKTLGFRGEALPSIAAVSRFSLVTRDRNAEFGTEIIIEGGKIKQVTEIGAPPGTMITVKQLFYNTPARRKFLKTISTEMGHIADGIAGIALGWPDVQFKLQHNGRTLKHWPSATDPFDRVVDVIGKDFKNELHRIKRDENAISISGWVSSARITRSTSRGIYVFINGRLVRDRVIQHALSEGYAQRLMKGQFPVAVLFIQVPFDQVDVNVHPTKHEVRFANQKRVHEAVAGAVAEILKVTDRSGWGLKKTSEPIPSHISDQVSPFRFRPHSTPSNKTRPISVSGPTEPPDQTTLWEKKRFGDLRVIGQLHNTYILCESAEALILIDHHAAHERVLYEQIKDRSAATQTSVQRLLIPETIECGYKESSILERLIPDLKEVGLEIEPFGGNTFVVTSVPSLLADREIKPLIIEIIEKMVEIGFAPGLKTVIDECLILMACHGAMRANQPLTDKQIRLLLEQLDGCDNSSHCPHGRPTWIKWTTPIIEKSFKRTV